MEQLGVSYHHVHVLHLTRRSNCHFCPGTATLSPNSLYLFHDVHAFCNLPKYDVLTVQPRGNNGRNEELG